LTDTIEHLREAQRHHAHMAVAIAEVLASVEASPLARLRAACAIYDAGDDPTAQGVAAALTEVLAADDE
jgi:hypothetical protein